MMPSTAPARRHRTVSRTLAAAVVAIVAGAAFVATSAAQPAGRPERGPDGGQHQQAGPRDGGGPRQGERRPDGGPHGHALTQAIGLRVRPANGPRPDAGQPDAAAVPEKPTTGLIVTHVVPDSAAAAAGLKEGDRLAKVGDQIIVNVPQLVTVLALNDANASVNVEVSRAEDAMKVTLTLDQAAIDSLRRGAAAPAGGPPPRRDGRRPGGNGEMPPPPPDGAGDGAGPDGMGPPPGNH